MNNLNLRVTCSECEGEVPPGTLGRCPACGGILRVEFPVETIRKLSAIDPGPGIDRYRALMPVETPIPFLGEGDTPLLHSRRLGPSLGLERLYFKAEGRNPSGAFKDRPGSMSAALAKDAGKRGVVTASSGNAASAIATYCAAAGLACTILMEPGNPPTKLRQALAMGAQVLMVDSVFERGPEAIAGLIRVVADEANYYPGFVWAPVNPYILESIKTISYEVVARLPGAPDVVICPVGGGDMLTAQWRGYKELQQSGVIKQAPRMVGVQSESAPPLLKAFRENLERVPTLGYADSEISGINVPFSGDHALRAVRESGGSVAGVTDDEALVMQARLGAEEGIWVEPVSAVTLAALAGLIERGEVKRDDRIVCVLSGGGFKDSHLAESEAEAVSQQAPLPFDAEAILKKFDGRNN